MTTTDSRPATVRVFVRGSHLLRDNLLSPSDGGSKLDRGIVEVVGERFPGYSLEVAFEACQGSDSFRKALSGSPDSHESRIRDFGPDIVVLSSDADLNASTGSWGETLAAGFESNMLDAIRHVKHDLQAHVMILNASSVVPDEIVSNYQRVDAQPHSLDAHRTNLATMRLSFEEGISIVDVDRLIAELGGAEHVSAFLDYSTKACGAICQEFVRIIEDYGFLDSRPLLPQVGRSASGE